MDKSFLEGGDFNKFFAIKRSDIERYATNQERIDLENLLIDISIAKYRDTGKGNAGKKYLVINIDEPYAPEIVEILKKNGHWG